MGAHDSTWWCAALFGFLGFLQAWVVLLTAQGVAVADAAAAAPLVPVADALIDAEQLVSLCRYSLFISATVVGTPFSTVFNSQLAFASKPHPPSPPSATHDANQANRTVCADSPRSKCSRKPSLLLGYHGHAWLMADGRADSNACMIITRADTHSSLMKIRYESRVRGTPLIRRRDGCRT